MVERELADTGRGAECAIDGGDAGFDSLIHFRHFLVDEGALHGPGAEETPAADGHLFDEEGFGCGGGLEFAGEGFVDDHELREVFDVETGEFGGEVWIRQAVAAASGGRGGVCGTSMTWLAVLLLGVRFAKEKSRRGGGLGLGGRSVATRSRRYHGGPRVLGARAGK